MVILGWFSHSARKSAALTDAELCFSAEELEQVREHFKQNGISDDSTPIQDHVLLRQLCGLPQLPHELEQGLVAAIRRCSPASPKQLNVESVIIAKAGLEKCGDEAALQACFSIMDPQGTGVVACGHLNKLVRGCLQLVFYQNGLSGAPSEAVVSALVTGALHCAATGSSALNASNSSHATAELLTADGYRRWCKSVPALQQLLSSLLSNIGRPEALATTTQAAGPALLLPAASLPEIIIDNSLVSPASLSSCLMEPSWAWVLRHCMPSDQQQEWRQLFISTRHGRSFSTLVAKLGEAAPTLLLVRDKSGFVFGAVASQPWQKRGTFYGDFGSFVLSLLPACATFHASGINQNFQWCGIGFSQLPNGLGLGGQVLGAQGHFAVYIDSTLEAGVSRPSATYANPCLASEQTFQVAEVECWLLKRPEEDPLASGGGKAAGGSILDRNKEDQHLLQLAGVGNTHSHGLRKPAEPIE